MTTGPILKVGHVLKSSGPESFISAIYVSAALCHHDHLSQNVTVVFSKILSHHPTHQIANANSNFENFSVWILPEICFASATRWMGRTKDIRL